MNPTPDDRPNVRRSREGLLISSERPDGIEHEQRVGVEVEAWFRPLAESLIGVVVAGRTGFEKLAIGIIEQIDGDPDIVECGRARRESVGKVESRHGEEGTG
jgi:hypothetical protein